MDYEQDYSKLTSCDNQWYNRRNRRMNSAPVGEEENPSNPVITLDNEDFN